MSSGSTIHLTRSAAIYGFGDVLARLGHEPHRLVHQAGLPYACLSEAELRIPTHAMLRLLESAAEQTGVHDLGLRIAANRPDSSSGAFGVMVRDQATLREMLQAMVQNIWIQIEGLIFALEEQDGLATFAIEFVDPQGQGVTQAVELVAANIARSLQHVLGPYWEPEMVIFRHSKPESVSAHLTAFRRVPFFMHDRNAIVMLSAHLDRSMPRADPEAAKHLAHYLQLIAGSRQQDFIGKVRQLIAALLPQGLCRMDRLARQLDIHERTLHRRLEAEGTSFGQLLLEVRTELLETYLAPGQRSLTEISELLGFSSLSAFSRWKRGLSRQPNALLSE
ncbi:MAG: AraC family transcriptional regulator ligand-binding domain-containing protein [Sphingomonadales bacterium]|nr:AraC family transcriptional regulator ligand-binding domain-containing protein [Sphingomonadales bacterium]MDE2567539.1 AraC family transcriptional regulator ligand-binding domain-containing protein [Sphingomonadales bacterium]